MVEDFKTSRGQTEDLRTQLTRSVNETNAQALKISVRIAWQILTKVLK
jgi:hypothetical protein